LYNDLRSLLHSLLNPYTKRRLQHTTGLSTTISLLIYLILIQIRVCACVYVHMCEFYLIFKAINYYNYYTFSVKNTVTSSLSENNRANMFPFESHRTSVWKSKVSYSESKSKHIFLKMRVFSALLLIAFTIFTDCFKVYMSSSGNVFEANACRWITQCVSGVRRILVR
jgi:hypothetical protein